MSESKRSLPLMQIMIAAIISTIIKNVIKSHVNYLQDVNIVGDAILFFVIYLPIIYFISPNLKRLFGKAQS